MNLIRASYLISVDVLLILFDVKFKGIGWVNGRQ